MENNHTKLNRLSKVNSNGRIHFSHCAASPGSHCPMHTALAAIRNIKGVSSLVIGMPECCFYSRYVMEQPVGMGGELHYTYVLDANEVIFGCRDGLKAAVKEMIEEGANYIILLNTCVPSLIGEDIEGITEEVNEETDALTVSIPVAHFERNGYEAGYYEVYGALSAFIGKDNALTQTKEAELSENSYSIGSKCIAILGTTQGEEADLFKKLLKQHEYQITEFTPRNIDLNQLKYLIQAKIIIVNDIHFLPLAEQLKEKYKVTYIFMAESYNPEKIRECYQEIFKRLLIQGNETSLFLNIRYAEILRTECKQLQNIDFVINTVISDVLSITSYLSGLGMNPLLIHIEEYTKWMEHSKNEILAYGKDPLTVYMTDQDLSEFLDKREEGKILVIGNNIPLRILEGKFGYDRTACLNQIVMERLEDSKYAII